MITFYLYKQQRIVPVTKFLPNLTLSRQEHLINLNPIATEVENKLINLHRSVGCV